ncbi:MAG: hypothetical protein JXA78_00320 [Anaerolineales bacterium]|nr:hypothetical protein [Anaerolineales bacterium]
MKVRRPCGVTLLVWLVIIVAAMNLARLALALQNWDFLAGLLPISPLYQVVSGALWSLVSLPLFWGLWRGKKWAPLYWRWALLAYSMVYWVDRLLLPSYPGRNINWPFVLGVNLFLLVWSLWVLSRPKARDFFGVMHERKPENPGTT